VAQIEHLVDAAAKKVVGGGRVRYFRLYNHRLPQPALKSKTPIQAIKAW